MLDEKIDTIFQAIIDNAREQGETESVQFVERRYEGLQSIRPLLKKILSSIQNPQQKFLKQLLQTIEDSSSDGQAEMSLYTLLITNLDKLNDDFLNALRNYKPSFFDADLLLVFGVRMRNFPLGDHATNIEISIASYEVAETVITRSKSPEQWATLQNNLGVAYRNRVRGNQAQNIERAIEYYIQASEVRTRQAFPKDWADTQHNLGSAYSERVLGDKAQNLERAIGCYQHALIKRTREKFPDDWADTQNSLGNAYYNRIQGDKAQNLEEAIACFDRALEVRERSRSGVLPQKWGETQNSLCGAYIARILGDRTQNLKLAVKHGKNALQVFSRKEFPELWATIQNNLGGAYLNGGILGDRTENLKQAITYFENALSVFTREAFPERFAATKSNLAQALIGCQETEKAISLLQKASQIYTRDDFPLDWARNQLNLADAYLSASNLEQAIKYCKNALQIHTRETLPIESALTQTVLGMTYQKAKRWQEAYDIFVTAIDTVEYLRGEIYSGNEAKRKLAEKWNSLYRSMVETCLILNKRQEAVEYLERSKTRNLVEMLEAQSHPELEALKQIPRISFAEIQTLLDDKTLIVEWHIGIDTFQTFLISTQLQQPVQVWESSIEDYEKLWKWFFNYFQLYDPQNELPVAEILHFEELVTSIREKYPQCKHLILIPHWLLHLLPLHALPLADGQCLLDKFTTVRYAPSCQILQQVQQRPRPEFKTFFAVQNPTRDLIFADFEVEAIREQFGKLKTTQKETEKSKVTRNTLIESKSLPQTHCIHFSCHGTFNLEEPLKSSLLLADNENLTLSDIFGLHLDHCRLVTLSACETGQVDPTSSSDEYVGLPAGFLYAGANSVVSSLWSVDELSTALLLIKFYENFMNQPDDTAKALNAAQNWLRQLTRADAEIFFKGKLLPHIEILYRDKPATKERVKEQWRTFLNEGGDYPFKSPYHWAAFTATGI